MGPIRRFIREEWQTLFSLAAVGISAATVGAEFGLGGPIAGGVALTGLLGIGSLWLLNSSRQTDSNLSIEAHDAQTLRKLADAARILEQQEASAKLLVRRDLELTRANERLQAVDRLKSDFVTIATHQLRTPLAAVRWTLQMLMAGDVGPVNDEQRSFLEQAYDSNNNLIALLHDMLLADQIESGTFDTSDASLDPVAAIEDFLRTIQPVADKQGVGIRFEEPASCPPLRIAPDHFRAILQNLVENAIKYTPSGGSVTIEVVPGIGQAAISVADTGIGIPADAQDRIFSRFFRARNAISMATEGTGLGLFIAKRIVEHYKGMLSFTSTQGAGTTFVFTLPNAPKA